MAKAKLGRPTKLTPEVIERLRYAYMIGSTNAEACAYAEIGERTLYDHIAANSEFSQKIDDWKLNPILKAKTMVVENLSIDLKNAQWYLERRAKEFKPKQDITTNDKDLPTPILNGIEAVNIKELNVSANYSSQEVIESNQEN